MVIVPFCLEMFKYVPLTGMSFSSTSQGNASIPSTAQTVSAKEGLVDIRAPIGSGGKGATVEEMKIGGSGCKSQMDGLIVGYEKYKCSYVINAAGSYSDAIANMINDKSFKIKPRLGDYLLLNRNQGKLTQCTLFPCPGPYGKGVLVQTTLWGNLILGPTARDMHNEEHANMDKEQVQQFILSKCKSLVPSFDPKEVIHAFCGTCYYAFDLNIDTTRTLFFSVLWCSIIQIPVQFPVDYYAFLCC